MNGGKWETDGRESFSFLKSHINNINSEVFSSSSFRWTKKLDLNLWEIRINGAAYVCGVRVAILCAKYSRLQRVKTEIYK